MTVLLCASAKLFRSQAVDFDRSALILEDTSTWLLIAFGTSRPTVNHHQRGTLSMVAAPWTEDEYSSNGLLSGTWFPVSLADIHVLSETLNICQNSNLTKEKPFREVKE